MSQQQSQLSAYDDDEAVAVYECPYCEFTNEREWLVRAHIHRSEEEPHHLWDGFMPEDEVAALTAEGDLVAKVPGQPRRRYELLQSLGPDDMPSHLSQTEKLIVLIAVQNLTENYSTVTERVNSRLFEEGLDTVEYNKVYRTTVDTLGVARKSKDMSQQQTQKSYDDLTDKQRAVINEHIRNPDQSKSSLAENAGVDPSYPQQVLDKYGAIAENMTNADVVPVETDAEEDTESPDTSGDGASTQPDVGAEVQEEYDGLTQLQQEVVDQFVEYPEKSHKEIAQDVGCDGTYPGKVEQQFDHIIKALRGESTDETGRVTVTLNETDYDVPEDLATELNDLTQKQQAVVGVVMTEATPTEPDRSREDIGEAAGVHGTYVNEVLKTYGDLATRLKEEAQESDSTAAAPTSTEADTEPEESAEETESVEEPSDEDEDDSQTFEERFRDAIDADNITTIPVREISEHIDTIEDVDLLKQAQEVDSRKTSGYEYEDRLAELTDTEDEPKESVGWVDDDTEEVAEDTPEPETETGAEETTAASEPSTDEPFEATADASAADGAIPVSKVKEMQAQAKLFIRTAESELESSDQKAPAARAKSIAEEFDRQFDELLAHVEG